MLRRIRVFQRPLLWFDAKMCVHIPNKARGRPKAPLFSVDTPITSVLALWKTTPTDPVPIKEILTREKFDISKECSSNLKSNQVTNTKHWAALSEATKKRLKLPDSVISALDTSPEVHLQLLQRFGITTVGQWQELSDTGKQDIKNAGMPEAVINDLTKAVRIGLCMPKFKYCDLVKFLLESDYANVYEARVLIQFARNVDETWVLTRKDCDVLCHNYGKLVEIAMKLALERWNNMDDATCKKWIFENQMEHLHRIDITQKGGPGQPSLHHHFFVRYPKHHNLHALHAAVVQHTPFNFACNRTSLNRITSCSSSAIGGENAQGDAITCSEFFQHAQVLDDFLIRLLDGMRVTPMSQEQRRNNE